MRERERMKEVTMCQHHCGASSLLHRTTWLQSMWQRELEEMVWVHSIASVILSFRTTCRTWVLSESQRSTCRNGSCSSAGDPPSLTPEPVCAEQNWKLQLWVWEGRLIDGTFSSHVCEMHIDSFLCWLQMWLQKIQINTYSTEDGNMFTSCILVSSLGSHQARRQEIDVCDLFCVCVCVLNSAEVWLCVFSVLSSGSLPSQAATRIRNSKCGAVKPGAACKLSG